MCKDSPGDQASRETFHVFVLFIKPLIPTLFTTDETQLETVIIEEVKTEPTLSGWQGSQSALFLPTTPKCTITCSFHPTKM